MRSYLYGKVYRLRVRGEQTRRVKEYKDNESGNRDIEGQPVKVIGILCTSYRTL
jgi:hypothetical protein